DVLRDVMYDGNPAYEKGAVVCRVANTFIRFGNFQIFAARQDVKNLKLLTDYTIRHFYPEIKKQGKEAYIAFFKAVTERTLDMIVHWQRVGFVHGVMNTDNFSILGQTIDYGPYGWLEGFDHNWTPNTTDKDYKRYRFGNQPQIGLWNLLQLGNALYPLIEEVKPLQEILDGYSKAFPLHYLNMMRKKLGLQKQEKDDSLLIQKLEKTLQLSETDMTIFFRNLCNIQKGFKIDDIDILLEVIKEAFYDDVINEKVILEWKDWFDQYLKRLKKEELTDEERSEEMNKVNPKYVLRNYMAQLAIDKSNDGDHALIDELYTMLKKPYDEQPQYQKWFAKRPEWARHKVGCSMLSCSS
ncbi:MAG: YdiU family protein, partial [Bacteroidia bacterium]|nr:YdiU family protein [Bacteroidia bacterium]